MQIILCLILILILILLWNSSEPFIDSTLKEKEKEKKEKKEDKEDKEEKEPVWNPDLKKAWDKYYKFYSPFMKNWQSSIIQLQSTEKTPAEKKSPSDTTPPPTPIIPTLEEQNAYLEKLEISENKSFTVIVDPVPIKLPELTNSSLSTIIKQLNTMIPSDTVLFINT